ncbi:SIR2 family protein [Pseudomonas sp. CCOS 191]|uniref:SIR2 family protein n=1 Tax=Pseudomonas sp. CCOS 191 TaxID=1649877 RepID=UPI0006245FD1|nr:SIR2 family protein [Pseudomonas sp. CCOS 191]CRI55811.1 hypothetical protein CCOS191_1275 [Pseudomonas sp. CCOS 191]
MHINDYVAGFSNHPVLFVGTGFSLRYLEKSYTWDGLLKFIASEFTGSNEYYFDVKARSCVDGKFQFDLIASRLEEDFTKALELDRNGKFKAVNDSFYEYMEQGRFISRLKIYISKLLDCSAVNEEKREELADLKKAVKNIGSIITTNYDQLLEEVFEFSPLIGNDILLSNPYGSIYKIHGCVSSSDRVIITKDDYDKFDKKYELIRAQLLSLFIHNPIVFVGYSINDDNIKKILRTVFTYVEPNSEQAARIRRNFLLVEYESGSASEDIFEHDIELEGMATIRISKIKTDNFSSVYRALSSLNLPVSAMDVRKVQNIVHDLKSGGDIKVHVTEDLDELGNGDKIIAIGSSKSITYRYMNSAETISNYFKIIDEENSQLLSLVNKFTIGKQQFFPVFAFSTIQPDIEKVDKLKEQQRRKVTEALGGVLDSCKIPHSEVEAIMADAQVAASYKTRTLFWCAHEGHIALDALEVYLRNSNDHKSTEYRKLLCLYDVMRYS